MLLYRLFPEKCESKSGLVAQVMLRASVRTRRTRLSMLLVSAVSSPGHRLRVSSERVRCHLRYTGAAVTLSAKGGGVLWLPILGFYVTSSLCKPLSVNKTGGACLAQIPR